MIRFDYHEPRSVQDACALLDEHGDDARVIAGGTAMLIMMRMKLLNPRVVVSLAKLPDFDTIRFDPKNGLTIGAGARHRDIELHPAVREHYPLLHETFQKVAQPRIRNMATIGVALALRTSGGRCDDVRLALNSAAPTIFRAKKAEAILRGQTISDKLIAEMSEAAAADSDPIDDNRGSSEYKREMVKVLVRRAAAQALR